MAGIAAVATPVVVGVMNLPAMRAQSAPTTKFEVASIKPCKDTNVGEGGRGGGGNGGFSPGRLDLPCQPVRNFIRVAYVRANFRATGGDNLRLEGGPAWIDSTWYRISAKAEGPASLAEMEGSMLQNLLEERFQLKIHRETRESQIYTLSVANGGLKLKPSAPGSCIPRDPADTSFAPLALSEKPHCGEASIATARDRTTFTMAAGTIRELSLGIGDRLGRPVVDKTGITEKFDFHVEFAREGVGPSDDPAAPSLLTVLKQLGLKLEAATGPRDFLIIDHVEKPTEN